MEKKLAPRYAILKHDYSTDTAQLVTMNKRSSIALIWKGFEVYKMTPESSHLAFHTDI